MVHEEELQNEHDGKKEKAPKLVGKSNKRAHAFEHCLWIYMNWTFYMPIKVQCATSNHCPWYLLPLPNFFTPTLCKS